LKFAMQTGTRRTVGLLRFGEEDYKGIHGKPSVTKTLGMPPPRRQNIRETPFRQPASREARGSRWRTRLTIGAIMEVATEPEVVGREMDF